MEKSILEKQPLQDQNESSSLIKKIYLIIRSNWLALTFALLICLITIIAVPIIYSIDKSVNQNTTIVLSWNVQGITIVNQQTLLNGLNSSLGLISALQFDSDSNLYLLDKTNNRILKYSFDQSNLILIAGYYNGTVGQDTNSFNSPNDFVLDSSNLFYVADTFNHRILCWNMNSNGGIITFGTGQSGSQNNQLNSPMSVTMDGNSNLYIADYGNNRIIQYNLTNNQSQILIPYNILGDRNTYVYTPISIKFDQTTNSLVIGQQLGYNVVRWTIGASYWQLIGGSASSDLNGTSRTLFNKICSIDIDDEINTYVVDCNNQRIQFFQGDGTPGKTIAGVIQAIGNTSYLFNQPTAITFDQNRNLYVADSNNFRIQMFQRL